MKMQKSVKFINLKININLKNKNKYKIRQI